MKKYLVIAFALVATSTFALSTSALAQAPEKKPAKPTREPAGRTLKPSKEMALKESYPDSVEFKKAFEELYSIVKPEESIKERTEKVFKQQSRTFTRNGIDSAKAHEAVFAAIDPNMDREIIYTTYRTSLTAEELKSWIAFIKTPAGKKILEVGNRLLTSSESKVDQTIRRTVSNAIASLRKPVQKAVAPNGQPIPQGRPQATPRSNGQETNESEESNN